jgi:hypothetical protein
MGEEAKREIRTDLLTLDQTCRRLADSGLDRKDWSGLPVPVPGLTMVLEPRYKYKCIEQFRWKECYDENGTRHEIPEDSVPQPSPFTRVNSWWNARYQANIIVFQDKQGRARFGVRPEDRLSFTLRTLEAAAVWPVEAEDKAQKTSQPHLKRFIRTLSTDRAFCRDKQAQPRYLLIPERPSNNSDA